jgi:hypothetical protein
MQFLCRLGDILVSGDGEKDIELSEAVFHGFALLHVSAVI